MTVLDGHTAHPVQLTLNGRPRQARAEPRRLLSDFLRHDLGATGTHVGCEHGVCGACTVLIDGTAQRACLTLAVQADGRAVCTVEGLAGADGVLGDLQAAFRRHHALQCGFCTPGILMSCVDWLQRHADGPVPQEDAVRAMLSGHLCRCTGYTPIVAAVLDVARRRRGLIAADDSADGAAARHPLPTPVPGSTPTATPTARSSPTPTPMPTSPATLKPEAGHA